MNALDPARDAAERRVAQAHDGEVADRGPARAEQVVGEEVGDEVHRRRRVREGPDEPRDAGLGTQRQRDVDHVDLVLLARRDQILLPADVRPGSIDERVAALDLAIVVDPDDLHAEPGPQPDPLAQLLRAARRPEDRHRALVAAARAHLAQDAAHDHAPADEHHGRGQEPREGDDARIARGRLRRDGDDEQEHDGHRPRREQHLRLGADALGAPGAVEAEDLPGDDEGDDRQHGGVAAFAPPREVVRPRRDDVSGGDEHDVDRSLQSVDQILALLKTSCPHFFPPPNEP